MTNIKKIVNDLLDSTTLEGISVVCGYPNEVQKFPLICWVESSQYEEEFSDNKARYNKCEIEIHIYTKKLTGYQTTNEIARLVDNIFYNDFWTCANNIDVGDTDNSVEHRVLYYRKEFLF